MRAGGVTWKLPAGPWESVAMRGWIWIFFCFSAAWVRADEPVQLPSKENFHLFLLVGQSNMAGRGIVEPQDKVPFPRVLMLNKRGEWVPAVDPLHFDKPAAGVGLGRSFAAEIAAEDPNIVVGLIPCAVGGSPINAWKPGQYYSPTKSHPWDDAIRRAKLAQESGTLKGILWHQGESDSNPKHAAKYADKLNDLVVAFRDELGADTPFIVGRLGQFDEVKWTEPRKLVDKAHRELPQHQKNVAVVDSKGLTANADKIHFDAESCREFGKRYAKAYRELTQQNASATKQAAAAAPAAKKSPSPTAK